MSSLSLFLPLYSTSLSLSSLYLRRLFNSISS